MRCAYAVAFVLSTASLAHAGGTSGSGTGGSDTGESPTGTETSTDPDGSTTNCGTCSPPDAPVMIVSPADGATVPANTMIDVEVSHDCSCDDCGCFQDFASDVTITVDGEEVFACFDGCTGSFGASVTLSTGPHEIVATAQYSFHTESATVTVNVTEGGSGEGSGGGSADSGSADSGGDAGGGGGGGEGGCGCVVDDDTSGAPAALGALLLVLGISTRRRRFG